MPNCVDNGKGVNKNKNYNKLKIKLENAQTRVRELQREIRKIENISLSEVNYTKEGGTRK